MSFVPEDELKGRSNLNLAPMIDFLFLMLMFFACLAITRVTTKDTDIDLVEIKAETQNAIADADADFKIIQISITADGQYKWVTEVRDHVMDNADAIGVELLNQYSKGLLPADRLKTQVLLKIDQKATWDPILKAIFAIRDAGFEVRPVYQPEDLERIAEY
jgi:biopolymer transport protein ExbD